MVSVLRMALATPLLLLAAAPAPAQSPADKGEVELAKLLDGRTAGKPVDCISLPQARSTRVIRDTAIVYEVGNILYVNRPTGGASLLDDNSVLVTRTFGDRLCSIDTVTLVDRSAMFPRGVIGLGEFVPYTRPRKR